MKRTALLAMLLIGASLTGYAQTEEKKDEVRAWELKGVTGLNFSQTTLSNWSAGGENSYAGTAYLNGNLVHKNGPWAWTNTLALEYGLTNTKSLGTQKSTDKIDFATQLGYTTNHKWYYSALADFKSQFYKGYNYPNKEYYISKFMAPAYSSLSLGIEYRPNDDYSAYLSPVAGRLTFVIDDTLSSQGAFGVKPGEHLKTELGAYLKLKAQKKLMENVTLITKADFFTAYNSSFGNVDVEWDVLINMKINKYLSANLNTTLKYDDDVKFIGKDNVAHGAKVQFKEVMGIGVAYNF
ncbi:MAG: DUF3078 domain-containing protein [Prevotella sp.]|jgi:hypothetical protein|nr:DUF3078 domain-containing protein [Prevotella sp.]